MATQTPGKWVNEYYRTKDGVGREVFWMTGQFDNWDKDNEENDEWALANGYAAVVPVKTDMTAYDFIIALSGTCNVCTLVLIVRGNLEIYLSWPQGSS